MPGPFQELWKEYEATAPSHYDLVEWLSRVLETARTNTMSVPFCIRVSSDIHRLTASGDSPVDQLLWECSKLLTKARHEQIPLYWEMEVRLKQQLYNS